DDRIADAQASKFGCVAERMPFAGSTPLVELRKLHVEHCCLQRIEPAVETHEMMIVPRLHTMVAQHAQPRREFGVVGRDQTAVAEATQVLGWIKAEAAGQAHRTGASALVFRAN